MLANLRALNIIIELLQLSCEGILAITLNFMEFPTTYWYPLSKGVLCSFQEQPPCHSKLYNSQGESQHGAEPGQCCLSWHWDMHLCRRAGCQKQVCPGALEESLVLTLLFVLELGITPWSTFLAFLATFCYTYVYLNSAENVPVTLIAPPESSLQKVHRPEAPPESKHLLFPKSCAQWGPQGLFSSIWPL